MELLIGSMDWLKGHFKPWFSIDMFHDFPMIYMGVPQKTNPLARLQRDQSEQSEQSSKSPKRQRHGHRTSTLYVQVVGLDGQQACLTLRQCRSQFPWGRRLATGWLPNHGKNIYKLMVGWASPMTLETSMFEKRAQKNQKQFRDDSQKFRWSWNLHSMNLCKMQGWDTAPQQFAPPQGPKSIQTHLNVEAPLNIGNPKSQMFFFYICSPSTAIHGFW